MDESRTFGVSLRPADCNESRCQQTRHECRLAPSAKHFKPHTALTSEAFVAGWRPRLFTRFRRAYAPSGDANAEIVHTGMFFRCQAQIFGP